MFWTYRKHNHAIPILLFLFNSFWVSAQKLEGSNWLFGDSIGLAFNQGQVPIQTNLNKSKSDRGPACISDAFGNLLFYTDGDDIYNKKGQIMPNGENISAGGRGTAKSSIITKVPGAQYRYWVIIAGGIDLFVSELRYTEVDIRLNDGFGGIVAGKKNLLIQTEVFMGIALADHANGVDKWLILNKGRKHINFIVPPSNTYEFYLVSNSGISFVKSQKVLDPFGIAYEDQAPNFKVSPNSENLVVAATHNEVKLFKIAKDTGGFSRMVVAGYSLDLCLAGLAFSPNSKYLYVSGVKQPYRPFNYSLYQINLDTAMVQYTNSPPGIEYPRIAITPPNVYGYDGRFCIYTDLQLGPNGKIYIIPYKGAKFLGSIECPDVRGSGCGFRDSAIWLGGRKTGSMFPVLNQTLFVNAGKLQAQAARDTICLGDSVEILAYGAGAERFQWFRNNETQVLDTGSILKVAPTTNTFYKVRGTGTCAGVKDTSLQIVVVPRPQIELGADRQTCGGKTFTFNYPGTGNLRYHWQSNLGTGNFTTQGYVSIQVPNRDTTWTGKLRLNLSNPGCTVRDSIQVQVNPSPKIKPAVSPSDTSICQGNTAVFRSPLQNPYKTIWSTGDSSQSISLSQGGNYSVRFKSAEGCLSDSFQTFRLQILPLPTTLTLSNLKKDSTLCFPAQIQLGINPEPNIVYTWQGQSADSLSNQNIANPNFSFQNQDTIALTRNLKLETRNQMTGCQNKDSLKLTLVPNLRLDAGPDQSFCNENRKTIGKKGFSGFQYQWSPETGLQNPQSAQSQTNLLNPSFENILRQKFERTVRLLGCQARDSVEVEVYPQVPKPQLAGPQFVCPGVRNVPYQLSTLPAISGFQVSSFRFQISGGDSLGKWLVNWNEENENGGIKMKLGNIFGCQPDSFFLPVSITRNLRPKLEIIPGINDSLCLAAAQNIKYEIEPFNPQSRYTWTYSPNNVQTVFPTFNFQLSTFNSPNIYSLTLAESDTTPIAQCFGKTEYLIRIWPQPSPMAILGKDSLCEKESFRFQVSDFRLGSRYDWGAGKGKIENEIPSGGEVNYTADFVPNGEFESVQISNVETSEKGCLGPENQKTITIESNPKPEILTKDGPIRWNGLVQEFQAKGRQGSQFEWEVENGILLSSQGNSTASVSWLADQLTYSLQVKETTRLGCEGMGEKRIPEVDKTLFIPNLITANGDGKNDVFKIENLQFYPENELEIFDRWGKRIYRSSPYGQDWPKEKIRSGNYFFTLKSKEGIQKGWIWVLE